MNEQTFRRFIQQVRKVRLLIGEAPEQMELTFRLEIAEGVAKGELVDRETPEKVRLAVLTRPLIHTNSPIAIDHVWVAMKQSLPLDPGFVSDVERVRERVRLGSTRVILNGTEIPAERLYRALADGEFFQKSSEYVALREALSVGPGLERLWMHFYSYCLGMFDIAYAMADALLALLPAPAPPTNPQCIYCLTTEGAFTTEEHAVPEAFGNDDAILPLGDVCDACQSSLAPLDQWLANHEGIALDRVIHTAHTKKGKLPRATFGNMLVEKVRPGTIRITATNDEPPLVFEAAQPDGSMRFRIHARGQKPLDVQRLGRPLYKVGLAMLAFHAGRVAACSERYDAARAFVQGTRHFPNNLIVRTTSTPHDRLNSQLWDQCDGGGTLFAIDFWGVLFMLNLEEAPVLTIDPDEPLAAIATTLWIGE
ncbi:MAG: HNH endonuclease [Thermoanaerobaculia bacterium]|nr:HNH endonuclease [Thermoanaerobaculia bacterium]